MDKNFTNGAHKEETDLLFRAKKIGIKVLFDPACHHTFKSRNWRNKKFELY